MTGGRCYERKNEKYLTVRGTNAELSLIHISEPTRH